MKKPKFTRAVQYATIQRGIVIETRFYEPTTGQRTATTPGKP